jgi:hypothetical protein
MLNEEQILLMDEIVLYYFVEEQYFPFHPLIIDNEEIEK